MNILHYVESTDSRQGGVPRFVLDASRVMAAEGHASTILTQDTTETPDSWIAPHDGSSLPTVRRLPRPALLGKLFGPAEMREIRKHLKKADVLHTHCVWNPATLQIAAAARQMGVPYVASLHGMLDDWCMAQRGLKKRAYMSLGGRHFLEKAARIHCTARAEHDQSKKWFPNGAEAIIPYLMDLEPYRNLPGRELAARKFSFLNTGGEPTVLFLSRLHYKKGPELLLQAASRLKSQQIRGQVAFAGTGEPEYVASLKKLASQLGIANNVHFIGQVTGQEKISLYQNADLFVLPTSQENFGLVLIEALACGTPLITTKGVDIWQDVQSSGAAEIVDQAPDQLAASIAKLLSDESLRKNMGAKARPWVFETYGEQALIGRYENFYAECASSNTPTSSVESRVWDTALPKLAAV